MKDPVKRLAILSDTLTQLRHEKCTQVEGNPVSIVPIFVLEVLYALRWGGASDLPSLTDAHSVKIDMNTAYLTITVSLNSHQLKIESTWKQDGQSLRINFKADGNKYDDKSLSFKNEREKIRMSADTLMETVTKCVMSRLDSE